MPDSYFLLDDKSYRASTVALPVEYDISPGWSYHTRRGSISHQDHGYPPRMPCMFIFAWSTVTLQQSYSLSESRICVTRNRSGRTWPSACAGGHDLQPRQVFMMSNWRNDLPVNEAYWLTLTSCAKPEKLPLGYYALNFFRLHIN